MVYMQMVDDPSPLYAPEAAHSSEIANARLPDERCFRRKSPRTELFVDIRGIRVTISDGFRLFNWEDNGELLGLCAKYSSPIEPMR